MRLRVYLAPCGIGLGHITRMAPIAKALNRRGIQTVFSTYSEGLDYAKRNGLPTYAAIPIYFKITSDGTIDFKRTAATSGFSLGIRWFLRQVVREMQYMKRFRPDVVFSDSRASSLVAARLLRVPVVLMLNQFRVEIIRRPSNRRLSLFDRLFFFIANIGWLFIRTALGLVWGRSQVILIPDLPAPFTICEGNLGIPMRYREKVRLVGPVIDHNLGNLANDPDKLKRKLGFGTKKPIIYAAVSGPKIERRILAQALVNAFQGMRENFQIVLSQGEPTGERSPRLANGIRIYDWIENQDDFIAASDVVIGRAGHGTIMKSLYYGKPMILVPIPDHTEQYSNARRAELLQVAKMVEQNELNFVTIRTAIQRVLKGDNYKKGVLQIRRRIVATDAVAAACDVISSFHKSASILLSGGLE